MSSKKVLCDCQHCLSQEYVHPRTRSRHIQLYGSTLAAPSTTSSQLPLHLVPEFVIDENEGMDIDFSRHEDIDIDAGPGVVVHDYPSETSLLDPNHARDDPGSDIDEDMNNDIPS
ncbi:hypothetical protein Agabi119p4_9993 [Agaricus bisporus var. burnettii]|uniref:Uncharacterized protein n=1 Tax=Agaricus bisporus var. burnettii TaxID=192524 RepID=A0A8H7C444_AGABI|nr:hypothetical protein Agabi119p4_9993 [Agaricus bisporus var. burnettii]